MPSENDPSARAAPSSATWDDRAETPVEIDTAPPRSRREHTSTRTWREGSRTARYWDAKLIGWAALSVGLGLVAGVLVSSFVPGITGALASVLIMWAGLAVAILIAFRRGRPRGLLGFRFVDLLYALVFGVGLRTVQGLLGIAAGDSGGFPSYPSVDGALPQFWWFIDGVAPMIIAPVLEELLFHGVLLVAVYRVARRGLEGALLALTASTAAFVAVHALTGVTARWDAPALLTIVALTCGLLVLLTGRIWGAVLVHVVFNGSWVVLTLVGTMLQ